MQIQLQTDQLRVVLDSHGAELVSLQNSTGKELLWSAGPEWPRHAPVLFPVIGRLVDDVLHHQGSKYPMTQHGFARDCDFAVLEATDNRARFLLHNTTATEAIFPFPFSLEISWSLDGSSLHLGFMLTNTGKKPLPASIGWHPAFSWDAAPGWHILFAEQETGHVRRVNPHVQLNDVFDPTPVEDRILLLTEEVFADGAVIFESLKSRKVTYTSPEGPVFDLAFPDFTQFAIWKPPGAGLVCLEPWWGLPVPQSYRGEIVSAPGLPLLRAGATGRFRCLLTLQE